MRNIVLTILIVLATVFTLQNMHAVELVFVVWHINTVVALAILVALILGILIGALLVLPAVIRNKRASKQSRLHAEELETRMKHEQATTPTEDTFSDTSRF